MRRVQSLYVGWACWLADLTSNRPSACSNRNVPFREHRMKTRSTLKPHLLASTFIVGALALPSVAQAQDATNQPGTQSTGSQTSTTAAPEAGTEAAATPTTNSNE